MGAEADFYVRHYGGGVPVGATSLRDFEAQMLAPGMRYALVAEHFSNIAGCGVVAELGCGGAETLLILSQSHHFDRVVGIEIASTLATQTGIEILSANLNVSWPFEDGEVDVLIAMMIIEHLFDPFHSFSEIKRTLAKDGIAFVNLPLVTGIRNRLRLLLGHLPETSKPYASWFDDKSWDGAHLHYFSLPSIRALARSLWFAHYRSQGCWEFP